MNAIRQQTKILLSVLASGNLVEQEHHLINWLIRQTSAISTAQPFGCSRLVRKLKLSKPVADNSTIEIDYKQDRVFYQDQELGKIQILYKSPIPGELQARLAIESTIDRFLEYLQKVHQIVVLEESDRHVRVFIPNKEIPDFKTLWRKFLEDVAFSTFGENQLAGLVQTFIVMLNAITLSGRGFSTLDVPILTRDQANVLAAWYFAVARDVEGRQIKRQKQIDALVKELDNPDLTEKEVKSKSKELQDKQAMQDKEAKKYQEYFQKGFDKSLKEQASAWQELGVIQKELEKTGLTKAQKNKLQKQQDNLKSKVVFSQESVQQKISLLAESRGDPFVFLQLNCSQDLEKFRKIETIAKSFSKVATDQINATRGDIFTQCISEMYRLLETETFDPLPEPLLSEEIILPEWRSAGDDSKEFCYSCGVAIDAKTAKWQVLRFMFERPSQRRQSSSGEGRPHICTSCSALAFASPLKVADESIILKLTSVKGDRDSVSIKDYVRMLTNKEMHLSGGRYLILASDRTGGGDIAAQKLGQVQYAMAKVASIFPIEVLTDFNFSLIIQSSQPINLQSRHLLFIKGVMEGYSQSIIISGKDINMTLGDAVRYIDQDLPILAEYTLTKISAPYGQLELEKVREAYWLEIQKDLQAIGVSMESENQLSKRARLYRDVAALTGLTYAFAQSLENTAKAASMKIEDIEREVSKLIEKVDDAVAFCYYATLGDETKKSVQSRLYRSPYNYFVYDQTKALLEKLGLSDRETTETDKQQTYLALYADDVLSAYTHFAENGYSQPKDWNDLTYQLKLSLYTRFPELVRKLKTKGDK
ncbi:MULTISPECIES: hypothetical protein [Pseudanabaena]|uniref:Uncharacterized protein n=2 Tax=Pseudanabaena TaxID=1152 RepID=L8N1Z3_9CYAN|nr:MULTISPECIES: hypothetical protein [Pseudanabaena]ELS33114.1 hypothetical protein Pse7429DRAFT_1854 [Pseudanabaena biceps PCC 7429]MDG3494674.1 hypothetical protein [Pseudanabaena catenata USMAC16]